MDTKSGILMKSIGGFYYVRADGEDYECKARGSFRKSGNSPVAGDRVNISVPNDGFCAIEEILPRKNKLRRPALANLDILLLVCSTVEPLPNFTIIDKMTAAAVNNNMEPVIVVTKNDLENGDKIADKVYERHQLISSWLMILGVQEKTAIHDACRIEHIISEESFQALKKAVYELREQQAVLQGETADQV